MIQLKTTKTKKTQNLPTSTTPAHAIVLDPSNFRFDSIFENSKKEISAPTRDLPFGTADGVWAWVQRGSQGPRVGALHCLVYQHHPSPSSSTTFDGIFVSSRFAGCFRMVVLLDDVGF